MRMKRSKNEATLPELKEGTFRELFSSSSDIMFDTIYPLHDEIKSGWCLFGLHPDFWRRKIWL